MTATVFGSGTHTWTAPTTGTIVLKGWGPGGPGSGGRSLTSGGNGGGSGAYAQVRRAVTAGQVFTGVAPAGPAGGAALGGVGTAAAALTISLSGSTILQAAPGGAATTTQAGAGGAATSSLGDAVTAGATGWAYGDGGSNTYMGGRGGTAPSNGGAGGTGGVSGAASGAPGAAPGGGGGGGYGNNTGAGGAGGDAAWSVEYVSDLAPGHYIDAFTATGTTLWTAPADGTVFMEGYSGGGGGKGAVALSSGAAGGEGGYYVSAVVSVTKGATYSVAVPGGGNGGGSGANGTNGADMTITRTSDSVVILKAVGGLGATSTTVATGSDRTSSCVGDTINRGGVGLPRASNGIDGGPGGNGALPNGGLGGTAGASGHVSTPGAAPGGGGGGGANRSATYYPGAAGAQGQATISYYLSYGEVIGDDGQPTYLLGIDEVTAGGTQPRTPTIIDATGTEVPLAHVTPDLSIAARAVPSYCPAGHEAAYDVTTGTFNWTTGNTANTAAAIAGAASTPAHVVMVGDSVSEGWTYLNNNVPYNFTADRLHAWPLMMRDQINNTRGLPQGGTGYVRAVSVNGTDDERWAGSTVGSGWTSGGHYAIGKNKTATFTSDKAGDAVAVMTIGGGAFTVTIDGGAPQAVAADTMAPHRYTFTGLPSTTHTVQVAIGGTNLNLAGCEVYNTTAGIRIHNVAQGGAKAAGTGQPCWADTSSAYGNMLPVYADYTGCWGARPSTVFIMLGGNDLHAGTSAATMRTAFETIAAAFANAATDVIVCIEGEGSALFGVTQAQYETWYTTAMQMCLDHGWPLIDMQFITGGYNVMYGLGYTGDAYGHLDADGAKWMGRAYAKAVLS